MPNEISDEKLAVITYGRAIHALRRFTQVALNKEPRIRNRAGADAGMDERRG